MIENILKIVQLEAKWLALESSKDALQDKEKMNEIKEIQVSAKKAFSEITQNHSKTSVAEALQDSKLRSSLFKMYGRIFSRLAMNTQQMSKEERNLLIAVLENATKVFEIVSEVHINAQRGNSNPAQSVMDDLLSISLSVAMVFEDLKDRFLPSHSNNKQSDKHPSDRPARESEEVWEYLLDLVFDFMSLFFQASEKILTVSEFGHWQENLRRGVLSQLVLTSLLFATAQPATLPRSSVNWNRTSFKAVKLLHSLHLLFSTTRPSSPAPTTTITSFWRRSFPGFFSIIFNCITREKRSNMSEVRSVQWNYFMTLTLLNLLLTISRDDLSENQILLASQPASSPSTSSAVVFRTFLQSLPNKPPLADTQSEGDEPSTTLSPDKMDDVARITEFKSVEEMITWRVDLLQKLRQHLPSLLPALIAPLSLAQKREVERALLSLLTSATGFLGLACHDELLLTCWPPLVTERLLTNDPDDVTPVILLKSSPSLYERFRELLSSFLATSSSSSTSTNTQALTQQLATLLCLGGALEGSSSQSIGVTVTSVRGVTALFKIDVAAVRRALVFEEKSFHVRATSDVLEVTCAMCRFPWAIFAFAPQRATSSHSFDAENEEVARSLLRRLAVMVATSAHPSPSSFLEDFIAATERKLRHLLHAMTKKRVRRWHKTEEGEQGGVEEVLNREISLIADDVIAHMHFLQYALFALLPRPHLFVFPRHRGLRESSEEKSDVTSACSCAYCGKKSSALPASLLRCARCKQSYYCDRQHQQLHWTSHKKHCKPPTTTSNTTSNTTTSQSCQSQHHVLKSRYFDPVRALQATATTTSSSSSSSEAIHSLITPSSETVEIEGVQGVLTALIQLLRECLEGRFLLLSLATSQQTERGRFHLFLAPLYSILVGKTLEVIADVSVLLPRHLITSLILPALLYEVVECRVAEEKIVSVMAENCLLRLALATHGADVHSTSSHSEMESEEMWRSSLLSALCTRHLDIFTNDVANIFREAHLLLHPVAPLATTSSSSSSTSSTSFLLKHHPNDLHTSSQPLDRTALTQRALTFYLKHLLVHPSSPQQQRRRLFLLSKDLIEEVLKAVDLLPPHRSSSHFALTNTTAVLRECIRLLPQLYLSTSSFSSSLLDQKRWRYVSINLPQLLPRTSSVHPLLSAIARHNKEKDSSDERKEATMTSASSLPPWHTSFLLFLRGVWGLTATDNDKEEKEEKSCDITHNTNNSDISDSEEEDDVRERSGDGVSVKEERQQLLHFLVSLQHRLTYFFSSSTSSEAMLAVQKNSAEAMTSVFLLLYLLSSSSGKRRVFEQQLHLLNTTFLTSLRHLHSLLRVKLAETPLTSHTVRLDFIDVDRQRVTLALHDQQQQRLAVTSLPPTRQSLSQGAAPSFEKLYLCSDVYDFYSLMMRLPDVTSFLSFRLAEEILPELCTTLLLCLKLYLTTIPDNNNDAINTPSINTSSTSIAAKRFVRSEERVKLSLLHFLETCLQNEDFIVLFAPRSDVASQGMSSACDIVKSLIFYLLPLLARTESEEVTAVAYRICGHLGSLDTAFLSLLFDFVLNDNVSASQSDWLIIARDTSLHHNISQSDAASSPVLSNSDITALLKKYQQDSGLLDKVLSIQETLLFKQPTLATPYPIDTIERHQLQVFSRLR